MAAKRPRKPAAKSEIILPNSTPSAPSDDDSLEAQIARRLQGERPAVEDAVPITSDGPEAAEAPQIPGKEPTRRKPKAPREPKGLECRDCGCRELPVLYTRPRALGRIARVRECRHCGRRVTTYEQAPV